MIYDYTHLHKWILQNTEQKKLDTQEHIQYESIYMEYKNKQN